MEEVFPVLAGVAVGLATHSVRPVWLRICLFVLFGLGLGVIASWISGELAVSWVYVLIDSGQVIGAGAMTAVGITFWLRRRAWWMAQ